MHVENKIHINVDSYQDEEEKSDANKILRYFMPYWTFCNYWL